MYILLHKAFAAPSFDPDLLLIGSRAPIRCEKTRFRLIISEWLQNESLYESLYEEIIILWINFVILFSVSAIDPEDGVKYYRGQITMTVTSNQPQKTDEAKID